MPSNQRIEDYALIGDCMTAALVGRNGSIDWLCLPRFDSPACFAALLGEPEHGRWLIAPTTPGARVQRRYLDGSLILATVFETAEGAVELIDFMRPHHSPSHLVRLVRGLRGRVAMHTEFVLRFEYGSVVPWVERHPEGGISAIAGPEMVVLRTSASLHGEDLKTVGDFAVDAGETIPFVLSYGPSHLPPPRPIDPERALHETEAYWRRWSGRCAPAGPWSDMVKRSLVVLKGLTYAPTGGIVAAPTTSLPEYLGGARNWDYRYCWLRDATFTLLALMHAGYSEEARSWRDWLLRAVAGSPDQLQVIYGVAGERRLGEWEAPWLPGYEQSRPVRIGNAAVNQTQLDVFGEIFDAMHQADLRGIPTIDRELAIGREILHHLARIWDRPDEGIWEVRGPPQHFTHSKVMAWVAFDRGVKFAEQLGTGARGRAVAAYPRQDPRRCLRQGVRSGPWQLCPSLRVKGARCRPVAAAAGRLPAAGGPAHHRHGKGDRAAPRRRWLGLALRHRRGGRRVAAGRRRFFAMQLLARRQLHPARPNRRGGRVVPTIDGAL